MRFNNKNIVVTGAGSGLGQSVAVGFAREGGHVLLVDINTAGLQDTLQKIETAGGIAKTLAIDLSSQAACQDVIAQALEWGGKLDVLCNIAGVVRIGAIADVSADDWQLLVSTNMAAPFWLSQAAIPELIKTEGNIVNCLSQSAHKGSAYVVPYSMTKGAISMMTKSMAMEMINEPIRINAVSPGAMHTGMTSAHIPEGLDMSLFMRYAGIRPPAQPDDVAGMFLYAASDDARMVHGAILCVDGGTTAD
ncbi:MAG: SDR family oxidoreductase [Spongiibacteraceae bacterium]